MWRLVTVACVAVAAIGALAAPSDGPRRSAADLKAILVREKTRAEERRAASRKKVITFYGRKLTGVEEACRKSGKLEALMAVRREAARYRREHSVPEDAPEGAPSLLAALVKSCAAASAKVEADYRRRLAELQRGYMESLADLSRDLTRAGKMAEARQAREAQEAAEVEYALLAAVLAPPASPGPPPKEVQPAAKDFSAVPVVAPLSGPVETVEAPSTLLAGLAGYWPFDETGAREELADLSGNGRHAVVDGVSLGESGQVGRACRFDGVKNTVFLRDYRGVGGANSRTVAFWVYVEKGQKWPTLVHWGVRNRKGATWDIRLDSGRVRVEVQGGYVVAMNRVDDKRWRHVAVAYEDKGDRELSNVAVYVDGKRETFTDVSSIPVATALLEGVTFGDARYGPGNARRFGGLLDEMAIWERALSPDEIELLYDLGRGGDPLKRPGE